MTVKDLHSLITIEQTLVPQTLTGSGDATDCTAVDGKNALAVEHVVLIGNSADTLAAGLYISLILQHSAAGSSFAAVTDASHYIGDMVDATTGQFALVNAPTEDQVAFNIGYRGPYRYSRVEIVRVGNHASGTPCGAIAIKTDRFVGAASIFPA